MADNIYNNNILNYNYSNSARLLLHVEKFTGTRRKNISYAYAKNILGKALICLMLMFMGVNGVWGQPVVITTPDDITNDTKKLYLIQTNAFESFFMAPQANNTITTNNIRGDYMLWYFLDAGVVDGIQYYYIVNNSTGKYIYNHNGNSRGINLISSTDFAGLSNANKEKCKFKIVENNTNGTGYYNINVKANQTYYGLNKQNGSEANAYPIRLTNSQYINDVNSTWKFIRYEGSFTWTPPFTPSTDSDKYYYQIQNVQRTTFHISTDNTPDKVTFTNQATERRAWYFKEASADSWFQYYYIINPSTGGKYMYYNGTADNTNDQTDAVSVKEYDSNNEDRYQFVVVQAARGDGANRVTCYAIIPKLLIDNLWTSSSIGYAQADIADGLNMGIINSRSASNGAHWDFKTIEFNTLCNNPDISFSNTTGKVTLSTTTTWPSIYYTTNGTTPSSSNGTKYTDPFDVTEETTIKAIVTKTGFTDSEVITRTIYKVATPTIQNNSDNTISITCATSGADIYYTTDGSTPTTSSTKYTAPLGLESSGKTIKAIAVKNDMINSAVGEATITFQCAKPIFTRNGNNITISCAFPEGAQIYYIKNGGDADPNTLYEGAITVDTDDIIKAIAIAPGFNNSEIATKKIYRELTPDENDKYHITSSDEFEIFTDMANSEFADKNFILDTDVTGSAVSEITQTFTGTFDGGGNTISGLRHALFNSINGGIVKNVFIDNVSISNGTNVGAICNEATGDTRIYNCGVLASSSTVETNQKGYTVITSCSSTISGSNYVGGIVGLLDGSSRVINCFSYANITGGTNVGGIVGYNNVATTSSNLKTMVMNCMFYGDITGGSDKAPIYNGTKIVNQDAAGVSNYNYFFGGASYVENKDIQTYNCALMAEVRYLQRFEFFRHLLNSHLELAGWWATGRYSKEEMLKWVEEPNKIGTSTPYPVLKTQGKYASVVNIDAENATTQTERNKGGKLDELTVNIRMGTGGAVYGPPTGASITTSSLTLNVTDKDPAHFNFNYKKVQLPYYNDVGSKNYTGNRVVTGWKIVSISGGTEGSFTTGDDATATVNAETGEVTLTTPYNFADRNCTNKDLYSKSGRIFNQGAYWDVPEGVTDIIIEPYWAKAAYLADSNPDVVYNDKMDTRYDVPNVGGGQIYTNEQSYTIAGESQVVYTTIANARNALGTGNTVYDNAIVLVGNAHNIGISSNASDRSYTIMSADFDHDNEPDYSYILRFDSRNETHPVRVDFLNIPGLGMAQKSTGGKGTFNFGIMQPIGWFESTNTSLFRVTQLEYDRSNRGAAPLIVQGGVFEQWVSGQTQKVNNKTTYFHVGGNVWFKEFHRGSHQDNTYISKHPPVSVTGGDYDEFYLTGLYRGDIANYADNAECYINGGRFGIVAGAAQEGIGKAGGADNTGNLVWQIQNADINEFYGGGQNAAHPVEGNITTVITGGYIKQFCGGPKFGDMNTGKTVKTTATGTQFDTFYGAGYGGNSYSRFAPKNINDIIGDYGSDNWNTFLNNNYKQEYKNDYKGVSVTYHTQYIPMSKNDVNVARLLVDFVSFSLARTRGVTSMLTNCTINQDFYGGGNLGKVEGDVTSTLDGCTVRGNVYGAGYGGSTPTVDVINTGNFVKAPYYDENLGVYFDPVTPATVEYTWAHRDGAVNTTALAIDKTNHILYTNEDLNTLGTVTGVVTLNINGSTTTIGGNVDGGNVYGGGALSDVSGDDGEGNITSHVSVNVNSGSMVNVFGGGKGESTVVRGNVVVNIGAKDGSGNLSGDGEVRGNVYGGSAFGAVNASSTKNAAGEVTDYTASEGKTTLVNIYGGAVTGSVFGGGLGQTTPSVIAAQNFGNTTINMEGGTVSTAIYGGSNANGVLKLDATLNITGGTVGTPANAGDAPADAVFGGGYGEPTVVEGDVTVNIGREKTGSETEHSGTATINGNVYGGGALGDVNANTTLNLLKGTINGNVFGGGLGRQEAENVTPVAATVGGDVLVTLDGAKVTPTYTTGVNPTPITGQIFGANNLNGSPLGHVTVHIKRTVDSAKDENTVRTSRTTYDIAAVYGGGNQADYIPTDATLNPEEEGKEEENKAKIAAATAEVLIEGCQKTSINYVYGGGNAAAVPATKVTVLGTYIINTLYGGGNGAGEGNLGANVGYKSYSSLTPTAEEKTSKQYGSGKAETKLFGGYINNVYGASNTRGDVRGGTDVRTKSKGESAPTGRDCCGELNVGKVYGAGSHADMDGDVNIVLECMPEDYVDQVFGGAEQATVNGNVSLVVTSGKFGRVFGGNNAGGDIHGSITVNVSEDGCKALMIGELYGGGNNAPYSIYGCTQDGNTWTANTSGTLYFDEEDKGRAAVEVYVYSCTSIGKIFGGGNNAEVIGNTRVWVNTWKGYINGVKQDNIGKIGQVFGGGNAARVVGNTQVDVGTALANAGEDIGVNITKGTYTSSTVGTYISPTTNEFIDLEEAGIYGGGFSADVEGNTTLNIGTRNQNMGVNIAGNIFGGGYGETTHVTGNVTVNIGTVTAGDPVGYANITGDVYGGSAKGTVNSTNNSSVNTYTYPNPENSEENLTANCYTKVNFYGGTITGNLYGGGLGEDNTGTEDDHAANVFGPVTVTMEKGSSTNTVVNNVFGCNNVLGTPKESVTVNVNGGTVNNSVYGGGNQAAYTPTESNVNYPAVNINNGTVTENVFGGGLGETATVTANPHITIGDNAEGHTVTILKSVYGGGSLASVDGSTNIVVNNGTIGTEGEGGATYGNIYGGGFGSSNNVRIGLVKSNTEVTINGGNVLHNIYGGGAYGSVGTYSYASDDANAAINGHTENTGKTTITILGGTIGTTGYENGMIFGASRGDIAAPGAIQDNMAWVYDTEVVIGQTNDETAGPQIKGSVYGSGENGHTYNDASVTIHSGKIGITEELDSDPVGQKGAYYPYRGNVYGGGCGTDKYYADPSQETHDGNGTLYNITAGIVGRNATVTIDGGHVVRNVYGAGAMGSVTGGTTVNISGISVIGADGSGGGYVYAAARGYEDMAVGYATVGSTALNISGGTIWGSAFGGGQLGTVKGSVAVTVSGGVVKNDVYGGGALANTNTDNWNTSTNTWNDTSTGTYYSEVKHLKYVQDEGVGEANASPVNGYYVRSGDSPNYTYTLTSDTKAQKGTTYYKKHENFLSVAAEGTEFKTIVSLTGGTIGNAYGGGLGRFAVEASGTPGNPDYVAAVPAVEAMVYGDVTVTVDGTKFTQETERVDGKAIPTTGRVFGCNNKNGTPKGSVNVVIKQTKRLDDGAHVKNQFEIQGVYGGGNMADYVPETYDNATEFGQSTHVLIEGCDNTSIERVYGGGNASNVPVSDVVIEGAFQIGYVFGGGNGGDKISKDDGITWEENPGAKVAGYTNVLLKGGTIGEAFGGSDSKGTVGGSDLKTDPNEICELVINNVYGASKEADFDGDVLLDLSRCSGEVDKVFGGSYNANVRGNVTINITSGIYTSVYGGNDRQGTIGGNIIINIEEVDQCNPIIIQNLFGGGSQADYPGTGALTYIGTVPKPNPETTPETNPSDYSSFTTGSITINIKAATRIDRVFGGCDNAKATGNTAVNINMVKGSLAGNGFTRPATYTGDPIPNMHTGNAYAVVSGLKAGDDVTGYYTRSGSTYTQVTSGTTAAANTTYYQYLTGISYIDNAIGTIGSVYGGGNQGDVDGNTIVNIGTVQDIGFVKTPAHLTPKTKTDPSDPDTYNVLGAHITGSVFGGGNEANVTGNTTVNIGTADYSATTDFEGISIDKDAKGKGGTVYGGGNQGNVLGNTYVTVSGGNRDNIGNGLYIYNGIFGGGYSGSVGTFTRSTDAAHTNVYDHKSHEGCIGKPISCAEGTGLCTVVVTGGQIGPVDVAVDGMNRPDAQGGPVPQGWVWGGGCGLIEDPSTNPDTHFKTYVGSTDVTIGGTAFILESVIGGGEFGRVLGNTLVKIQDQCQIGVGNGEYNKDENNKPTTPKRYTEAQFINPLETTVTSGVGGNALAECSHFPYGNNNNEYLPYDPYYKYFSSYVNDHPDLSPATTDNPSDGKTWIGCVFGGGSGYMPYKIKNNIGNEIGYDWCRSAGWVEGDTEVRISGGHILTNVYGGNEYTDVKGTCTVTMTGGTLGVPRTLEQIAAHPVTCYLFGGGKGDERSHFNQYTNVGNVVVNVRGGIIYGSVFGGAEDGHVIGDATVNIESGAVIGTWGTSYVDGNIFGGGRGFSGGNLAAGAVGGNTTVNITGGTMLGSIYGGGRLASVGIGFMDSSDSSYGQLREDEGGKKYGHITVNISGGTIGNDWEFQPVPRRIQTQNALDTWKTENHIPNTEFYYGKDDNDNNLYLLSHTKGGNVFGGSMGRLTLLNGSTNDLWPKLGTVKTTKVNIYGNAVIKGNVYGGAEFSMTRGDTYTTVGGILEDDNTTITTTSSDNPTIKRNVFGGGYGSDDFTTKTTVPAGGFDYDEYTFTPMQLAGIVCGDTYINIKDGQVEKNIYGGGEMATVGLINFTDAVKHDTHTGTPGTSDEKLYDFALSWPYKMGFIPYMANGPVGGTTNINIDGGRIGITGKDYTGPATIDGAAASDEEKKARREDNGDVFGGGKGKAGSRYDYAFCANVKATKVNIEYPVDNSATPANYKDKTGDTYDYDCITGSVYGGGENGHVIDNTKVILKKGLIGHAMYGGGKGKDTYKHELNRIDGGGTYTADIYSVTAGKVYGNTYIEMEGGYVVRNIYGGGNMASTGKGNYSGGADDYSESGYGETLTGNLWDNVSEFSQAFLSSGKTYVNIKGGQVGYIIKTSDGPDKDGMKDGLPYGNVFGGARGASAPNIEESPRYLYAPLFYSGYVNETHVHVYDSTGVEPPKIFGSVYGGGQDGHVRRDTHVIIDAGEIGKPYTDATTANSLIGTSDLSHPQWLHRGNVYGSGSGIGKYEYDFNNDGDYNDHIDNYGARKITLYEKDYSNSAGSVTRFTNVQINGGTIHRNVYGGGSLANVGAPKIGQSYYQYKKGDTAEGHGEGKQSGNEVNITGGTISSATDYAASYGGNVFGASRGLGTTETNPAQFSTSVSTEVNITPKKTGELTYDYTSYPTIAGNVYGGGEAAQVRKDTKLTLIGGIIGEDVYGGGKGNDAIAADVGGRVTVDLNGITDDEGNVILVVPTTSRGCSVRRVFGGNDLNGTPRGHVKVHVHATQHKDKLAIHDISKSTDYKKYDKFSNIAGYSITSYDGLISLAEGTYNLATTIADDKTILAGTGTDAEKTEALKRIQDAVERAELAKFATELHVDLTGLTKTEDMRIAVANKKYDVEAVYGGGDLALYQPFGPQANGTADDYKATTEFAEVIIDGCEKTSIRQVYGGGNAASTPANLLNVYGTYEIDELFGGGNGKDAYQKSDGKLYQNPGANVGYYDFMEYITTGTDVTNDGDGSPEHPYVAHKKSDAIEKEYREANYWYGTGKAETNVIGGRIHFVYGGSNEAGNIRTLALSVFETSTECQVVIDKSYGAGKNAEIDGEARIQMNCVDYMGVLFGGSTDADVHSDVNLTVTNGHFGAVYGGNDTSGHIYGAITVTIKEEGCKPIVIDKLYGAGLGTKAPYSIYGYYNTGVLDGDNKYIYEPRDYEKFKEDSIAAMATVTDPNDEEQVKNALLAKGIYGYPKANPQINVISATKIGEIFGGGNQALVIGSPHINVNMEQGYIAAKYVDESYSQFTQGAHEVTDHGTTYTYYVSGYEAAEGSTYGKAVLAVGTIDNIFGGGDQATIDGDTYVELGTGTHLNAENVLVPINTYDENSSYRDVATITRSVFGGGNSADVTGNTKVLLGKGSTVGDRVFGGGNLGGVGTIKTKITPTGHSHSGDCIQKPTAFEANTGTCTVTVTGGYVGPFTLTNYPSTAANSGDPTGQVITPKPMHMKNVDNENNPLDPDDYGYVFGASRGDSKDPAVDPDIEYKAYVNETHVTIKNGYVAGHEGEADYITRPLIAGGVYGGSENGHVLKDTWVNIEGGQIGLGEDLTAAYAEADFIDPLTATPAQIEEKANAMPECAHWDYGKIYPGDTEKKYLPYDQHAIEDESSKEGSDGHTFYGNVFGGGSGYWPYAVANPGVGEPAYEWLETAGMVEGNTHVTISGGHVLTNIYGGNEMTSTKGKCYVEMTGGTLGLPRTLAQIAAHPVTCYLFGAGKGDQRSHFNKRTDVQDTDVKVTGGIVYGSVFGGGEDGHVLGSVTMTIGKAAVGTEGEEGYEPASGPIIGTWGTSYVDGNVFGGGRGFSGEALTAGVVCGDINLTINSGTMLGSIYGGGRLGSVGTYLASQKLSDGTTDNPHYGAMIPDGTDEDDVETEHTADAPGHTHGHITINISGGTIGNNYEFIIPNADNTPNTITETDISKWTTTSGGDWEKWKNYNHVPNTLYDSSNGRVTHTKGGNVFTGGMGRRTALDGSEISNWTKLGNVKSTKLTISGDAWIKSNVYGGGEFGAVTGYHTTSEKNYGTEISITGGTIGVEVTGTTLVKTTVPVPDDYPESGNSAVQYTFGSVYGGGYGTEDKIAEVTTSDKADLLGALVTSNSTITMSGGHVRASVFGGGELAALGGNTNVTISGGEIGRNEVKAKDDSNPGYVMFGGATMGNVYGGGKGSMDNSYTGQVMGNTNVNISGGSIYHIVYGGGALGSVGTFDRSDGAGNPAYIPMPGVPYQWRYTNKEPIYPYEPQGDRTPTGTATVNITGGTIGISGRDNGLVFGSSRGGLSIPVGSPRPLDPCDNLAWVYKSVVNIGTLKADPETDDDYTTPLIKGSVYGGGENGHNYSNATVTINSGSIGVPDKNPATNEPDPWWEFLGKDDAFNDEVRSKRGNVYGAGSGEDTYTGTDKKEHFNARAGMVGGSTIVNIAGGHIGRSVYGGGAMSSVGNIINGNDTIASANKAKHADETKSFALSWPYEFQFATNTGRAIVNVTGGHIGTKNIDGGDVYGSSRGKAGDRYATAHLACVNETVVNINYTNPPEDDKTEEELENDYTIPCVTGSVHGSGEDGYVYGDARVTLNKGLIGHSIYGAGKGKGTYKVKLLKIGATEGSEDVNDYYDADVYSLIAGKVMGNTYVTMNGGRVHRNVYGGGNMASVGKGNYAGGEDDYSTSGYGENINENLWTSEYDPNDNTSVKDNAWHFLNSGKTTVNILGGIVGYVDPTNPSSSVKNNLPYGNVFGGCTGEAAPNIAETPRYHYCPAFFSGYVNETDVTIGSLGKPAKPAVGTEGEPGYQPAEPTVPASGPTILGSVYGGGQDGHVRRDTKVTVNYGEIGMAYSYTNRTDVLKTLDKNAVSEEAALTNTSDLDNDQWTHRGNVYGSGSGISKYKYDFNYDNKIDDTVPGITYNDKPIKEEDYSNSAGSVTRFTEVNINGGIIHRNVYGGGSNASVGAPKIGQTYDPYKKGDTAEGHTEGKQSMCTVTISGTIGTPDDYTPGFKYNQNYGGEVYGASRGIAGLGESFANTVWTLVKIKNGATILGNVFGGGDNGMVKKDSEVIVGDER